MNGVQRTARPLAYLGLALHCCYGVLTQLAIDLMRLDVPTRAKYKC